MKKMLKKSVTWLLLLAMLVTLVASMTVGVSAAEVSLGKAGDNIHAYYDATTKTLRLHGSGPMYDYIDDGAWNLTRREHAPWSDLEETIERVVIDRGITSIGNAAFYYLKMCKSYSIANTVTEIGEWAFANNLALHSITIPASVQKISRWAFYSAALTQDGVKNSQCLGNPIIESGTDINFELINDLNQDSSDRVVIEASGTIVDKSDNASQIQWHYSSTTKTLTLTTMATETVVMPEIVGRKPWDTFSDNITKIIVGNNIGNIGKTAFSGMTAISSVQLGQQVTAIHERAFAGCTALKQLQLPLATLIIDSGAFSSRGVGNTIELVTPNSQLTMTPGFTTTGNELVTWRYGSSSVVTPPSSANSGVLSNGQIQWEYVPTSGTLTLTLAPSATTAAIPDYTSSTQTPWAQANLNSSVTRILIGDGITRIGKYAFANMPSVQWVGVGKQVQSIGSYAFYGNSALPILTFPVSVSLVESNAFTGCSSLWYAVKDNANMVVKDPNTELIAALNYGSGSGTVTPPPSTGDSVGGTIGGTTLTWSYSYETHALNIKGTGAIPNYSNSNPAPWASYADAITAITVQSGITAIGDYAFANIKNVVDLYVPDTVLTIGNGAFYGCTSLKSVRLPSGLIALGQSAFAYCKALKSIELPDGITVIDNQTFYNCEALESVTLPANLVRIGSGAFYGCKSLKFVDFPSMLTMIGEEAFYGCSALTGVVFRSPSLSIGTRAFAFCDALRKAVCVSKQPTVAAGNELLTSKYVSRYGSGSNGNVSWEIDRAEGTLTLSGTGTVSNRTGWADELEFADTLIFSDGITGIAADLMKGDKNIETVVMADTVKTIGDSAFEQCTALEAAALSNNLEQMGTRVFYGCSKLNNIVLPDSLRQIPEGTFTACTALSSVTLGSQVTVIGANAFKNCSSLKSVVIPKTVTTIATGAFNDCTGLKTITLYGGALTTLPSNTFSGCLGLSTVYFNGSQNEWASLSASADYTIKNATIIYCVSTTVYFYYKGGPLDGQVVRAPEVHSGASGETKSIPLPEELHYTPEPSTLNITFASKDENVYVYYVPKMYTLTVRFVDSKTGVTVADPISYQVEYTKSFDQEIVPTSALNGYTLTQTRVTIDSMTGNQTVDIKCEKKSYTYVVEYINSVTEEPFRTETKTAEYGASVTVTPPTMKGYTVKNANGNYSISAIKDNNQKISIIYIPDYETLTIHYVDADGKTVAPDVTKDVYYGQKISVASPEVEGMTPDLATVSLDQYNGEKTITVKYDWRYCNVTIHFKEAGSYGYAIHDDFTTTVKYGDTFSFTLIGNSDYPTPEAYVPEKSLLDLGKVTEDIETTILYNRKQLTLTVVYTDKQGNVLDTVPLTVPAGTVYTVAEKEIEGYYTVEAFTHQMGIRDESLTVQMELDPDAPINQPSNMGKIIAVIVIIVLVLVIGGALFYFLYLKKKPY